MTSHDQLSKNLIQTFFGDFLHLVAPEPTARLLPNEAVFLDKQSFTDWPQGHRREMDLLAEVPLLDDRDLRMLVHVEIEARASPGMDRRMWGYYMQLRLRHALPVLPILVNLRGGPSGVCLETLEEGFGEPGAALFRYRVLGLSGCRAEEYLSRPEPLAWAFAALMRRGRWSRAQHKMECLRKIAAAELPLAHGHLLVDWVDIYLQLNGRERVEFNLLRDLTGNREVKAMQMTWSERFEHKGRQEGLKEGRREGRQEGRQEGLEEGIRSLRRVVLQLLSQRFGRVPVEVQHTVEKIDSMERLTELAEKVLVVQSLDEMELGKAARVRRAS